MVPLAPRYDPRILELLRALDDRGVSIAETCRRVGAAAARIGLFRPSYSHLRRLVHIERERAAVERERRRATREFVAGVATSLVVGFARRYEVTACVGIRVRGP